MIIITPGYSGPILTFHSNHKSIIVLSLYEAFRDKSPAVGYVCFISSAVYPRIMTNYDYNSQLISTDPTGASQTVGRFRVETGEHEGEEVR